jgi:hypothetical protein
MNNHITNRRHFLQTTGGGFGMLALRSLLAADNPKPINALSPQFAPRAKSVIFLFMYGGPSQVDTFDPKPALDRWNGKAIPTFRKEDAFAPATKATAMRSPYTFARHGQSGLEISEKFPHLARHADELCVIRSLHANSNNHGPALFQMNSGFVQSGYPSMGSWITYGLGSENENLPGYVVLTDLNGAPVNGAMNWSNGFMPATYQGVPFQSVGSPILYLKRPEGVSVAQQRHRLDFIRKWNERYSAANPDESALSARVAAYELAWRMQSHAPAAVDISRETKATREDYGLNHKTTEYFGRNCLLARRLVERGVRFVQIYSGGNKGLTAWDAHDNLKENHDRQCAQTDLPIATLLTDLKQRGLLDTTLVVWGGEFGRLPTQQGSAGRDHNPFGFTMWLAGGGVRGGLTYGATDEFGYAAVENKVHVHDLHATILHQLGLNHKQLTYPHLGRNFRLTDVEGSVVKSILA